MTREQLAAAIMETAEFKHQMTLVDAPMMPRNACYCCGKVGHRSRQCPTKQLSQRDVAEIMFQHVKARPVFVVVRKRDALRDQRVSGSQQEASHP